MIQRMHNRAQLMADNEFRSTFQKPEHAREYDLNDPEAMKNDLPARVSDDDPRMFDGEDLTAEERRELQKKQMQTWIAQQTREKAEKKAQQDLEERYVCVCVCVCVHHQYLICC